MSTPEVAFKGALHKNVLDFSGAPGGPTVNGLTGTPGPHGAASVDSSPGGNGGPGQPGAPGLDGFDGADGSDIHIKLNNGSDDQHVVITVGQDTAECQLPLALRSNGGCGSVGGAGGAGGTGGEGGSGCQYVAHEARSKFQWNLIGGTGYPSKPVLNDPKNSKKVKRKASAGDMKASSSVGPGVEPPPLPYAGATAATQKKQQFGYLEYMAWDETLWRARLTENGQQFIVIRNGETTIERHLQILDWTGEKWNVCMENKNTFVYSDPAVESPKPSIKTGALQYLDWHGVACEVQIEEKKIEPVIKLSNGGHGGAGAAGGPGGKGGRGGRAGNIYIYTENPALMMHVSAEATGGIGGLGGLPGAGGKGGKGGRGQQPGRLGADGITGLPALPGTKGLDGTVEYIRVDENGKTLQKGPLKPALKLLKMDTKCVNGSAILETTELVDIHLRFTNTGSVSIPPRTKIIISGAMDNIHPDESYVAEEWLDPGVEFEVTLKAQLGATPGKAVFDIVATVQGAVLYQGTHSLLDIQHPVSITKLLNVPHVTLNQEIELGAVIQNHSGIATGNLHNRMVRHELEVEEGISFLDGDMDADTINESRTLCSSVIDDLTDKPLTYLRRVVLMPDLPAFSWRTWKFRLFWKNILVGEVVGKVKMIPMYQAETAADSDVLLITHPGFVPAAYSRLMDMFTNFSFQVVTWDYYYHKGIKLSEPFRSKLIVVCLRDGADIELFASEDIRHHFFDEENNDQDSSLLILSPDPQETINLLNRRLVTIGHEATEEEMTRKYFGKPDTKDFTEVVKQVEKDWFPKFPDYHVWSSSREDQSKLSSGMRAKYKLGTATILRSTVSYFQRLYVMDCPYVTNEVITDKETDLIATSIRHALTMAQKVFVIETESNPVGTRLIESALYYDLKQEFMYLPRPLTYLSQLTDLLFNFTFRYATPKIVEAVLRILYRLKKATYWKSFGLSDFKSKYHILDATLKRLKESMIDWSSSVETTDAHRKLDMKLIDDKAQAGAKSYERVKWRRMTLPLRLRPIPTNEETKHNPPVVPPSTQSSSTAQSLSSSNSTNNLDRSNSKDNLKASSSSSHTTPDS